MKKTPLMFFEVGVSLNIAANGPGIYAVVAFPVPSVLVKDRKLN